MALPNAASLRWSILKLNSEGPGHQSLTVIRSGGGVEMFAVYGDGKRASSASGHMQRGGLV